MSTRQGLNKRAWPREERRWDQRNTWQTQTKTKQCVKTQDKQGNIEQRQHRQNCLGRILTHVLFTTTTINYSLLFLFSLLALGGPLSFLPLVVTASQFICKYIIIVVVVVVFHAPQQRRCLSPSSSTKFSTTPNILVSASREKLNWTPTVTHRARHHYWSSLSVRDIKQGFAMVRVTQLRKGEWERHTTWRRDSFPYIWCGGTQLNITIQDSDPAGNWTQRPIGHPLRCFIKLCDEWSCDAKTANSLRCWLLIGRPAFVLLYIFLLISHWRLLSL